MAQDMVNIICLKWGTRYPATFTNILYASVKRHLHRPFRFVCFTEDPSGLNPAIDAQPFPPNPSPEHFPSWPCIWVKLALFQNGLANLQGPTLFFDVDVVIQEDIDCLFDYLPGKNCIIHNWIERRKSLFRKRPRIGNSSCFRFEAGKSQYIYDTFLREIDDALDRSKYTTEQAFMTHAMGDNLNWWPEDWIKSFKRSCIPWFPFNLFIAPRKPKTKVLVFHGKPDPDNAGEGFRDNKLHHTVLPCHWVYEDWHE